MNSTQILDLVRDTILVESEAVASLVEQVNDSTSAAVRLMLACNGHVIVAGAGTSSATAQRFAHLLACCGTPAFFLHPGDSQHGSAGAIRSEDVLVALSKGGETAEVNFLAEYARKRQAKVIGITESAGSSLGRLCDVVIEIQAGRGVDPYGMIATGSSLFTSAFCDGLCVALLRLRNYSQDEFGQTHPGGAVGLKLRGNEEHA